MAGHSCVLPIHTAQVTKAGIELYTVLVIQGKTITKLNSGVPLPMQLIIQHILISTNSILIKPLFA